jgi:NAD-dependent deacetylase
MPQEKVQESLRLARECDLCLVLGSSLVVYPAASIPAFAAEHGAKLVIINRDETPLDRMAQVVTR